jgi:hypothetical protein
VDGIVVLDVVLGVVAIVVVLARVGVRRIGRACRAVVGAPVPRQRSENDVTQPEDLEAVLAVRVVHGQLSRGFYHQRMAEIAAADDVKHHLTVPLD